MIRKIAIGLMVASFTSAFAQDGATLFKNNCGMCHKLGSRLVGPDLTNVTQRRSKEWLHKFIKSSQSLVKSGDKDAVAIFNEFNQMVMPDQNVTDAQIDEILKYIEENSSTATASAEQQEPQKPVEPEITDKQAFAQLVEKGAKLFDGRLRFQNGGPTCISCHNVNSYNVTGGGSLAKDLTDSYTRIGEEGIKSVLSGLPFPAMKNSFEKHPITEEEAAAIAAFLRQVSKESHETVPFDYASLLVWGGIPGIIILLGIYSIIWYNRKKKTVNYSIYSRQIKSY
ncbi:MAG: hypothetical protein KatS3mg027_1060 [Bacteroidia bacterium]|nr:MAG: hypothetical protein KatS3mg027_1060 [Bacteroidia bacterium]